LYFAYRNLEAAKAERDSVHSLWRKTQTELVFGKVGAIDETRALQQYFRTRARVEVALTELFKTENRLRFMLGLAPTDGRLIRPIDEPIQARVHFDWHEVLSESLFRSCELRTKRWLIKQRELELIQARNQILPRMDAVALYRWLGRGDDLVNQRNGPPFINPDPVGDPDFTPRGSDALEELFHGDYQEWRLGVEFALPVGFRRELAGIRNAQLQLARECALLKETELELTHHLTDAMQNADSWYELSETNFNRRVASEREVTTHQAAWEGGLGTLDQLLDAVQRRADAQALFYRSMVNYTISISEIHFHKGSLLEHDNVHLAEGPWPAKAYCDAQQRARERAAGHYLDYGFTRPRVISRGPVEQFQHAPMGMEDGSFHDGSDSSSTIEEVPPGEVVPTPAPQLNATGAADSASQVRLTSALAPVDEAPTGSNFATTALSPPGSTPAPKPSAGDVEIRVKGAKFDWGPLQAKP
jgi:hypothetical protein